MDETNKTSWLWIFFSLVFVATCIVFAVGCGDDSDDTPAPVEDSSVNAKNTGILAAQTIDTDYVDITIADNTRATLESGKPAAQGSVKTNIIPARGDDERSFPGADFTTTYQGEEGDVLTAGFFQIFMEDTNGDRIQSLNPAMTVRLTLTGKNVSQYPGRAAEQNALTCGQLKINPPPVKVGDVVTIYRILRGMNRIVLDNYYLVGCFPVIPGPAVEFPALYANGVTYVAVIGIYRKPVDTGDDDDGTTGDDDDGTTGDDDDGTTGDDDDGTTGDDDDGTTGDDDDGTTGDDDDGTTGDDDDGTTGDDDDGTTGDDDDGTDGTGTGGSGGTVPTT